MNATVHYHRPTDPHRHPDGYRGWVRPNGRRGRWLEPFLLRMVADGEAHGSLLIDRLDELCVAPDGVDVGMAYRTLREFESEGLLRSAWITDDGPPRRSYRLTTDGWSALHEWIAVMRERSRLIEAFLDGTEQLDRTDDGEGKGG